MPGIGQRLGPALHDLVVAGGPVLVALPHRLLGGLGGRRRWLTGCASDREECREQRKQLDVMPHLIAAFLLLTRGRSCPRARGWTARSGGRFGQDAGIIRPRVFWRFRALLSP